MPIEGIEPCPECGHPCTYIGPDKGDLRFYSVRVQFFGCRHDMRVQLPMGIYPDEAATYINRAIVNRRG